MAHSYEVQTSDGTFNVDTQHHHDDHGDSAFKKHLLDIILSTASGVASGLIVHRFTYKGRR
jgi:hypothetical protein